MIWMDTCYQYFTILQMNMTKTKYKKYKTLYLPQIIVEAVIASHQIRLREFEEVRLDVCFDLLNNIIEKSNFNRKADKSRDLFAMMASRYLKLRYKNKYKIHKDFLFLNNLIYLDEAFKESPSNFYIQSNEIYLRILDNILNSSSNNIEHIPYCIRNNIEISLLDTIDTSVIGLRKNRIFENWYRIKILIDKSKKSFFTGDYEADSTFINNAPTRIKKMGSHFRNNFKLDSKKAIEHTLKQYSEELKQSTSAKEERKAYNRSLARMNSIFAIDNGKINKSLRFNRNSTNNRLDTNLTNLASDLKPFIVGWEDMVYLDLKNSQPVLFNTVLKELYIKGSSVLKSEIDNYRKATFAGKWYEELMTIFEADRDSCKEIWMCIAYSQNKSYQNYKKPFKKAYPEIYKIIESIKSSDYKNFAISLQKLESEIFIDKICKLLVAVDIIPFTVHDALIVKKSDQDQTLQIMENVFLVCLGDIPKISVE